MTLAPPASPAVVAALPYDEERRRFAYFLRSAALAVYLLAGGFALAGQALLCASGLVIASGFLGLLAWGRARRSLWRLRVGTQLALTWALLGIVWNAWRTGGNTSFALWFLAMLPLLSAFLGGRLAAYVWAGLGMLTAVVLWAAARVQPWATGYVLPPAMLLCAHLVLIFLSATFAEAARHANARHIEALAQKLAVEQNAKQLAETSRLMESRARLAAETASRTKSNFLATMSHEMRTPLNAVIGFTNLLLDMHLGERERQLAELAHQSGESLLQLINDILDFSKIEAGHLELEPLIFDPHLVVKGALALMQEQARRKGLALVSSVEAPHGLRGDPARLRQILLNLLSNAVKFTDHGSVTLRCHSLTLAGEARVWLHFEVQDSGIGIPAEVQSRLFQPFTQADASTTRRFGGTGLGLAICKELAALMGGRIGVQSAEGQGSLFWVDLPFESVPEAEWPVHHTPAEFAAEDGPLRGTRVLLAEDNAVNQIMAREMLKRLGCQVDVVGNGREALEAWLRLPYDAILMDCQMPVMDGFEASRAIRTLEGEGRRIPIIAMTAAALSGDRERCLAAGMDDYLPKPVRLADMKTVLGRWVHAPAPQPTTTP